MTSSLKPFFHWLQQRIHSFRRNAFFFIDRFKIPRSERRVLSLLFLATILVWSARLLVKHPQLIDPTLYEEEQAIFRNAFAKSYQDHQEILKRYGRSEPENTHQTNNKSTSDLLQIPYRNTVDESPQDTLKNVSSDSSPNVESSRLNLNTATSEQLITLPGIGPSYAERILNWRNKNGNFTSIDQLLQIKGIGKKRLEKLRPLLEVSGVDSTGYYR
jgi:comEA protein